MKAITTTMYVCGSLMVAAAIMGAVDYTSAQHKGTMDKLYKEEKPVETPVVADKEIGVEDYSRGEINRPDEVVKAAVKKAVVVKTVTKSKSPKPVIKKNKKLSLKKFSRAAIVDEIPLPDSILKK
jgi:hypothetical protein